MSYKNTQQPSNRRHNRTKHTRPHRLDLSRLSVNTLKLKKLGKPKAGHLGEVIASLIGDMMQDIELLHHACKYKHGRVINLGKSKFSLDIFKLLNTGLAFPLIPEGLVRTPCQRTYFLFRRIQIKSHYVDNNNLTYSQH